MKTTTLHLFGIAVLALVMITLPFHIRFANGNTTLAGSEPYYHARMTARLSEGLTTLDTAILGGRIYKLNPYHALTILPFKLLGLKAFSITPAILAILSILGYCLVLKKFNIPTDSFLWMTLAYILSPPLISAAFIATPIAFILVILLFGTWCFLSNKAWIGTLLFLLVSLCGMDALITALLTLLFLACIKKEVLPSFTITAFLIAVIFILDVTTQIMPPLRGIENTISDFGGIYGLSIFGTLLALVGTTIIWKHKKEYYGAFVTLLIFASSAIVFPTILVYINVITSTLAGYALATLASRKWQLPSIRSASLLVLFCGLLFSGISHTLNLANLQPTPEFFETLNVSSGTIIAHEKYGFWIEAKGHIALIDPLWEKLPDAQERKWDVSTIFASTDPDKTTYLLRKYGVTYILITSEMQHGLVWERENQGLHFLLQNGETFKRLGIGQNIELWQATNEKR